MVVEYPRRIAAAFEIERALFRGSCGLPVAEEAWRNGIQALPGDTQSDTDSAAAWGSARWFRVDSLSTLVASSTQAKVGHRGDRGVIGFRLSRLARFEDARPRRQAGFRRRSGI